MKHLHIICKATPSIFSEAIGAISKIFENSGWRVTYDPAFKVEDQEPYSQDANLVIKAQREYKPDHLPKSAVNILFQSEQFSKLRQFNSLPYSEKWDCILDVFEDNVRRVVNDDLVSRLRYLPIGFHPAYQWQETRGRPILDHDASFDVYFFGARTRHRSEIWKNIIKKVTPVVRFAASDHNNDKYRRITHSKVNVFINGWEPYLLPMMHCMQILANRKYLLVIGDPDQNTWPYENMKHFDIVKPSEAEGYLQMVLRHPEPRLKLADIAYEDILANHTFQKYLTLALKGIINL